MHYDIVSQAPSQSVTGCPESGLRMRDSKTGPRRPDTCVLAVGAGVPSRTPGQKRLRDDADPYGECKAEHGADQDVLRLLP